MPPAASSGFGRLRDRRAVLFGVGLSYFRADRGRKEVGVEPNPNQQDAGPNRARWIKAMPAAVTLAVFIAAASADYVVESGDTLNQIAADLGVSKAELVAINGISDPDLIRVGQVLVVPGQAATATTTHVVSAGETLAAIASKYGTSVDTLVSANALTNPNLIRIGQQILVASAPAPAPAPVAPVAGSTHTVSAGETLASIASLHGTTVEVIAAANGITNASVIYVGTILQLTGGPFVAEPTTTPVVAVHTVAPGESLAGVAAKYGTTVEALAAANGIADPNLIRIGQEIQVQASVSAWTCPVPGAHYFNDWGFPRSGGRFHEGNDLFAPKGSPVLAPVSGTVFFQNGPIGGLQFRMFGDDGTTYIGSHLDTMGGTDGYITAGSQLGTVGDTGNAIGSRPHLHFEMHPGDGAAANPYPTLQKFGC
jgi:LysM repeat protein